MRKALLVIAVALISMGVASLAFADLTDQAAARVQVKIDPNIAIQVISQSIYETFQTGDIAIPIIFRVDANSQYVNLSALVTQLYKADDPTNPDVAPIPVNLTEPVAVVPDDGTPGDLAYLSSGNYQGFEGSLTAVGTFESSQNGHFSQEVEVTPTWNNADEEKPQGDYSGWVVLYAAIP